MTSLTRTNLLWLLIYLGVMGAVAGALCRARRWAVRELASAESQRHWHEWQAETKRQSTGAGPVVRRAATSPEPPAIVLLRDYFPLSLLTLLLLGTVLFVTLMLLLRGSLAKSPYPLEDQRAGGRPEANGGP